jgi:hypothetical protein
MSTTRLCRQFGITLKAYDERPDAMETWCKNTIAHLLEKHGEPVMVMTLRVLTETHPNNRSQLNREVITAVHAVCRLKRWTSLGLAFLDPWDDLDLGELRRLAESFGLQKVGHPLWATLATLIITRLGPTLDPLKPVPTSAKVKREPKTPRSVTRVPEIEKAIALGIKLLELRATVKWNNEFGRLRRKLFDVETQVGVELMRIARLYGQRPEIYRRLSYQALVELTARSLPWHLRRRFEVAIMAGTKVTASQIRRARQAQATSRRPADQPAQRAAA